jgi:hypothetical protein
VLLGVSSISTAQVDTWIKKADMPTARLALSVSAVNGKIYAIGGLVPGFGNGGLKGTSATEVYDPATDTWTAKSPMPTPRGWLHDNAVVNGQIYIIGGAPDNLHVVSTTEAYDPATDTWTAKSPMPTPRGWFSTSVVDGKIYAIGGTIYDGTTYRVFSTVDMYNPATDTWTTKADMSIPRVSLSTSVIDGKIYAIGGAQTVVGGGSFISYSPPLSVVEVYDPTADTWTRKADMPTPRCCHAASVVNEEIYLIGGGEGYSSVLQVVEKYNPVTGTWSVVVDNLTLRNYLSASAVNGIVYAVGGFVSPRSTVEAYDTGVGIRVTIVSPQEGSITGGEPIAMSGTNFPPDAIVTIGGKPLINQEIINGTVISGITPPGTPGEYNILIDSPSIGFTTFAGKFLYPTPFPPTITAITPSQGPLMGGQIATIEGSGFITGVSVVISDVEAKVTAFTSTHVTFITPPHTEGAKFVLVRNVDRKVGFLDGGYTYIDAEFLPEDLNLDGVVNLFDLVLVASQFGQTGGTLTGDVNGDGTVDLFDLVRVASHFGETAVGAAPPGIDGAVIQSPERVRHALAELEAMGERPPGVEMAIAFLRAWLANPLVTETKLFPNYPNPFNPETWIPYRLATDTDVQVRIYDISGIVVRQLGIGHQQAGSYVDKERAAYWNGRDENGQWVSSGLYFYQLRAGEFTATKRMVILK